MAKVAPAPGDQNGSDNKLKEKSRSTYAVELECDEANTRHWRHPWCFDKNGGKLAERPPLLPQEEPATIAACINVAAIKYTNCPCMGRRPINEVLFEGKKQFWCKGDYEWTTFTDVHRNIQNAAMGLVQLDGVRESAQKKECVAALLADTSAEWQTAAQACFQCGITITTVYTTLGHEAMLHGLNQTKASILFIDWGQYDVLLKGVISKCTDIKHIVLIGEALVPLAAVGGKPGEPKQFPALGQASSVPKPEGAASSANIVTLPDLIDSGSKSPEKLDKLAPSADDTAFIMYTSGSTGLPKGVVLSHKNFVATVASILAQGVVKPTVADVYVAYLPLAHILELLVETICLCQGSAIGYAHPRSLTSGSPCMHQSNPKYNGSDLLALRPTILVAVPAILDLIKNGLSTKLEQMPGLKGQIARGAVAKARGLPAEGCCASCLVSCCLKNSTLKKVKAGLGLNRLRGIISGGAPLSQETQSYIAAVLAPVAQGYGATETTGCTTVQEIYASDTRPADLDTGHVGAIQPACEIKLVSVEDMNYLVTDSPPRGEILIAGNTVAQGGYFQMKEKTAEDFQTHSDGKIWFHTGDIGVMTSTGVLKIIDRKKDLIKLSGGEYVSLGKVEAALKQVPGIGAVAVFARSDKDHCVAIVSQPEKGWASVGGKPEEESLVKAIMEVLYQGLKMPRFEIPTKVKVDETQWTPESGLVTASFKLQRNPLREFYNKPEGLLHQMDYRFGENT